MLTTDPCRARQGHRMIFRIEIAVDNAAFSDFAGSEVARILRGVSGKVEEMSGKSFAEVYVKLFDADGKLVGYAEADCPPRYLYCLPEHRGCSSHAALVAALEGMARLAETEAAAGSSAWRKAAILARQVLAEAEKT